MGLTEVTLRVGNPAEQRDLAKARECDPLLGALALEAFGLMLDPLKRELRPIELRM